MILNKVDNVRAKRRDAVIEETAADLIRFQASMLENKPGELVIEPGSVDEFLSGAFVSIVLGPKARRETEAKFSIYVSYSLAD